ncbi:MAG: hypothetical protein JW902_08395 [Syntrophaceae bacterium]|nr:hypothetical protein [Syntrophaceae bacterium]
MHRKKITSAIIVRYILFQIPEFVLFVTALLLADRWMVIPSWFFWGFIVFLILKDAVIFPFIWHVYDNQDTKRTRQLIGRKGTVVVSLKPTGFVRVNGELWKAEALEKDSSIGQEEAIIVKDVRRLCLIVDRIDGDDNFQGSFGNVPADSSSA